MKQLTEKQKEVLEIIKKYIKENGYAPSVRELCDIQGLKSSASMWRHLQFLKQKGYIDYKEKQHRGIKVLEV